MAAALTVAAHHRPRRRRGERHRPAATGVAAARRGDANLRIVDDEAVPSALGRERRARPRRCRRRPGATRPHAARRCRLRAAARGTRRAGLAVGAQGLRAGALAAGADPHAAEGTREPDLGRLGLLRHARRPHRHQLPRRRGGGAQARAPRPRLRDGRRPRGAAADPAARRAARPRAAEGRRTAAAAGSSTRSRSGPKPSRCRRASASIRSATRSTSASPSPKAPTTASSSGASIRRSSSAARCSAGMSGGPALDQEGRVVGINVARRVDGEQVSFLVPKSFATALLARGRDAAPIRAPAYNIVADQLMVHQATLTERFIQQGWKTGTHQRYRLPVPPDVFMRCWGSERSVAHRRPRRRALRLRDGHAHLRRRLHHRRDRAAPRELRRQQARRAALRRALFAELPQRSVRAPVGASTRPSRSATRTTSTATACRCARSSACAPTRSCRSSTTSSVLVATLDQSQGGVQGRLDAQGVSFENAQRLSRHYLEAYGWAK